MNLNDTMIFITYHTLSSSDQVEEVKAGHIVRRYHDRLHESTPMISVK